MYRVGSRQTESSLGRFLVVSIVFHALVLLLYPQWEQSPIAGTLPGEGVFQFTLRQPTEASSFSLQRVTMPRPSVPQPQVRPAELQPVQPPQQQIQVAERPQEPAPQQPVQVPVSVPEVNPPPPQETSSPVGEPVAVPQANVPTPSVLPATPPNEVAAVPVITSETGSVPVTTQQEGSSEETDPVQGGSAAGSSDGTDAEGQVAAQEAAPPPPPPPAVGSMLSFPGGMFIPKNYDRGWGTVSVRVVVTVDELGNVVAAEIDPSMRAAADAINEWAIGYALQLVEAQPGPEGQAYQASFVIRFDPEGGGRGVTFGTDPEELIRMLLSD